ncbi:copper resistance CopC/CopD family protein [Streptomyces sp. NPDC096205]|uniref:copper resistance CopC/CopD family protein n=1 Tax=Streptomyces sp. NPDC096205 TaxID=3366081 RepID=UPI0037FE9FB9
MRRIRPALLLGILLLTLLAPATPASAHAALRGTTPGDGTVLRSAPRDLTLTFTESVALLDGSIRVLDPGSHRVRTGEPLHAAGGGDTIQVSLPPDLGRGTFTVAWRVVSADSHPVSGAFTFSVGEPTPTVAATAPSEDPATTTLHNTARYLAHLAAALLLGTAAFVEVCRPPDPGRLRPLLRTGWWTLLAATLALLLLRAPYEAGTGLATALDPAALTRTLGGRPGLTLLARLALLAATALYLRRPARGPRTGAALAVGLALTWATAEHASAGIQVPAAIVSTALHLLAMSVWLGGLAALLRSTPSTEATARFSRLALTCVAVLVLTGVYQSWRGLGSLDALTGTSYGRILAAKLAAVAVLLAAAAFSRRWTNRLATPRRSVLTEAAVGVLVLVLTTLLTATLPGRSAEAAEAAEAAGGGTLAAADRVTSTATVPFDVGTPGGHGKVQVSFDPARAGANAVQAVVLGPDGGIATVPELRISFTLPDQDVGPLDARLKNLGGYWGTDAVTLPLPGTWTMKLTVRTSELDQVTETAPVVIGP